MNFTELKIILDNGGYGAEEIASYQFENGGIDYLNDVSKENFTITKVYDDDQYDGKDCFDVYNFKSNQTDLNICIRYTYSSWGDWFYEHSIYEVKSQTKKIIQWIRKN